MSNFVYPFNFVPPAKQSFCRRTGYQPLNRYGGKTGRIEFTLTNLSPLFIPDAEQATFYHVRDGKGELRYDKQGNPECHRVADFFNVEGRLAIPGTALKGMFRAVAEALSSSSFGVFTPSKEKFKFGKTSERATVQEIARKTPQILPCTRNTALCPASRLFGWTPDSGQGERDSDFPVAGRVRVGVAWTGRRLNDTRLVPLQILSSPKPKYYPFYLRPRGDKSDPSKSAYYALQAGGWWRRPGKLRGRKFYLHHRAAMTSDPAVSLKYIQMTPAKVSKEVRDRYPSGEQVPREEMCSHQNMSAAVLPAGAEFKGYLEFDSLTDYELGLVLWVVSLADSPLEGCAERAHKLGLGRPLGLGSVQVKIDRIVTWDPVGGWRAAADPGEQEINAAEAGRLVKVFKAWLVTGQEQETPDNAAVAEFHRQEFYRELCNVLRLNLAGDSPVQYHPPDVQPYEGYQYFMEQRKKRRYGTEETLRTPQELRAGQRQTGQ